MEGGREERDGGREGRKGWWEGGGREERDGGREEGGERKCMEIVCHNCLTSVCRHNWSFCCYGNTQRLQAE